jgi:hypothetical protein
MKIERGVMLRKGDKAWGVIHEDYKACSYGWVSVENAPIHNPKYCNKPSDLTYTGDPNLEEMNTGKIVLIERVTTVYFLDEANPHGAENFIETQVMD